MTRVSARMSAPCYRHHVLGLDLMQTEHTVVTM